MSISNIHIPPEAVKILSHSFRTYEMWRFENYKVPYWKIFYNSKGISEVFFQEIREQRRVSLPDSLIVLIPPDIGFSCYSSSSIEHFNLNFIITGIPIVPDRHVYTFPYTEEMKRKIEPFRKPLIDRDKPAVELIMSLLGPLEEKHFRPISGDVRIQETAVNIDRNMNIQISNSQLAQDAGMSVNGFARLFREETGMTLYNYQYQRRLSHGAVLLLYTRHPIGKIARLCGFADRFHFSKAFKKETDMTPVEYRRKMPR